MGKHKQETASGLPGVGVGSDELVRCGQDRCAAGRHAVQGWNAGAGQSAGTTETRRLITYASGVAYTRFDVSFGSDRDLCFP